MDLTDYLIENVERKEVVRPPGSVNGQQFMIQGCRDATIYILDHINTVTVDDCENCTVILAAVRARSVYSYMESRHKYLPTFPKGSNTSNHKGPAYIGPILAIFKARWRT